MIIQSIRSWIKKVIYKILYFVIHGRYNKVFFNLVDFVKRERLAFDRAKLLSELQSCGSGVRINGKFFIANPGLVSIGNNVHIGDNAYFIARGSLTIGDNTHISRNVTIYTVSHDYSGDALPYDETEIPKPVLIGKNVWIGMNVTLVPGVKIGDGAVVGLGTVVTHDVPPCAIVGNQPHRTIKYRDKDRYTRLEKTKKYGGVSGKLLTEKEVEQFIRPISDSEVVSFFIVTTGRSGSTTIANLLNGHPQITCTHEPRQQFVRLSTEYAYGQKSYAQTKEELYATYCNSSTTQDKYYGECDQKFWNFIEILSEILPNSKFIWLLRDGRNVVSSTYARGWFSEEQSQLGHPTVGGFERYFSYRLNAGKCTVMTEEQWHDMSVFERNCWYWGYLNETIRDQLDGLPQERWTVVKLEELQSSIGNLFHLLGVDPLPLEVPELNKAISIPAYNMQAIKLMKWEKWDEVKREAFGQWGTSIMDQIYPEWKK